MKAKKLTKLGEKWLFLASEDMKRRITENESKTHKSKKRKSKKRKSKKRKSKKRRTKKRRTKRR